MKLLGSELSGHVSKSQDLDVDPEIVDGLEEASDYCHEFTDIYIGMGGKGIDEFNETGEKLIETAEEVRQESLRRIS